jgi:NAD(P)H dehydrogenase (quinone)
MKVGIMGASGALGSRTLHSVMESDKFKTEDIVALVRNPEKLAREKEAGVEVRHADYDELLTLEDAFQGLDRILLVPSMELPVPRAVQYGNVVEAAKSAEVRHMLEFGLVSTRLDARFVMTPFYLFAESLLRTSGIEWTFLRNSLYADPIADWVPSIVKMGTIPYPTGDGRCAYVSRDDIARAGAAALIGEGHEGKTYNLTGPEALSTEDLCNIVARVTGERVEYREASDQDYIDICVEEGVPSRFASLLLSMYHTIADGHLDVVSDDIERLTGQPPQSFEEYLRERVS